MIIEARPNTDNFVRVRNIKRLDTGAALDSITSVTASFVTHNPGGDGDGDLVAGSSKALTVSGDAATGYIPNTVTLVHGVRYRLRVLTIGVIGADTVQVDEQHEFVADRSKRVAPLI